MDVHIAEILEVLYWHGGVLVERFSTPGFGLVQWMGTVRLSHPVGEVGFFPERYGLTAVVVTAHTWHAILDVASEVRIAHGKVAARSCGALAVKKILDRRQHGTIADANFLVVSVRCFQELRECEVPHVVFLDEVV